MISMIFTHKSSELPLTVITVTGGLGYLFVQ